MASVKQWPLRIFIALLAGVLAVGITPIASAQDDNDDGHECSQAWNDLTDANVVGTVVNGAQCLNATMSPDSGFDISVNEDGELQAEGRDEGNIQEKVEEKLDDKFQSIIASFGSGALRGIMWMMTFWLEKPSDIVINAGNVDNEGNPKNNNNLIFQVQDYTLWLQGLFGVFSIFAIAVRYAMSRWSDVEDNAVDFLMTLGRIILTTAIWVPVIMLATRMSDAFAQWVINESSAAADEGMKVFLSGDGDFPENWNIAAAWGSFGGTGTAALVFLTSIISIITSLIQVVFSFMREGMLVILCVAVPMVAYASALESGKEAWGKIKGWTIALILFAPAAALVYAIAFLAVGSIGEEDSIGVLGVLVLFGMAVLVLPSLISLLAPQAGVAPAGGSGLKVAGSMVGAAATVGGMAMASGAFGGGGSKAAAAAAPKGSAGPDTGGPDSTGGTEGGGDPTGPTGGPGGTDGGSEGDGSSPMGSTGGDGGSEGDGGGTGGFGGDTASDSDGGDATSMGDPGTDGGAGGAEVEPPSGGESSGGDAGSPESGPSSSPSPQGSPGAGAGESGSPSSAGPQGHSGGSPGASTSTPSSPTSGQHRPGSPSTPPPAPPVTKLRDTPAQPPSGVPR